MNKHRIVVVGAGFAGLTLTHALAKDKQCEVVLVDQAPAQTYTPWLYEVVSGGLQDGSAFIKKLVLAARIPLQKTCQRFGARFRQGELESIDRKRKEIRFVDGLTLPFDTLIIATGVGSNDFGIPGVKEEAVLVKTMDDAVRAQHILRSCLQEAQKGEMQHVLVCGAGPNGVECAAEIAYAVRALQEHSVKVTLIEGAASVLPQSAQKLQQAAHARLRELQVEVRVETELLSCKNHVATIKNSKGKEHSKFDLCLFTAGTKPHPFIRNLGCKTTPRGRLETEGTMRVVGEENIFALGDCAAITDDPQPQTAQAAHTQAVWLAKQLRRVVRGQSLHEYKSPSRWYSAIAVGGRYAVCDLKGLYIGGYLGFLFRRLADVRYYYAVLPVKEATMRLIRALWFFDKNDQGK